MTDRPENDPPDPLDPLASLFEAATADAHDTWQRAVLFADVRRQRGDQYLAHMAEAVPNVLHFPAKLIMDGRDLPRPVN